MRRLTPLITLITLLLAMLPAVAQDAEPTAPPTPMPRPAPANSATDGRATLLMYFASLPQGSTGVIYLPGDDIAQARMRFLGQILPFHRADDGLYALVPVGLDVTPRQYPANVSVQYTDGTRSTIETLIEVTLGGFLRQSFSVPPDRAYLTAPEVERTEYARLNAIFAESSPVRLWDEYGFDLPMNSEITSPFGSFRTMNQNTQTRHTGWDFRAAPGTPIKASANGVIVFAGPLDIRGNFVVIDHGYAVFSGYAHLSEFYVTPGQSIERGQIIGVSGNTGRSSGPHLHWEISVNGEWVDSLAFTEMWLP